ncbi:MAG TPA: cytochrome c [Thermomicrobiales bacterium]
MRLLLLLLAGISARGRVVAVTILGLLGISLILSACGRIPESEAAKSRLPTETPTVVAAAQVSSGSFKLAETPAGNATSGQNLYVRSCQVCHGSGGVGSDPSQASLVGNDGLIVKQQLDTTAKFVTAFENNAKHAGFKDDPNQDLTPLRLGNVYAYLIAQMSS